MIFKFNGLSGEFDLVSAGQISSSNSGSDVGFASAYNIHVDSAATPITGNITIDVSENAVAGNRFRMLHSQGTIPTITPASGVVINYITQLATTYDTSRLNIIEGEIIAIDDGTAYVDIYIYQRETSISPQLLTVTVETANPNDFVMVFSEAVTVPDATGWTIAGTTSSSFASVSGSGTNTITLTTADAVAQDETITVDYDNAVGSIVSVSNSQPLLSISNKAVLNNVFSSSLVSGYTSRYYGANPDNVFDGVATTSLLNFVDTEGVADFDNGGSTYVGDNPLVITDGDGNVGISWEEDNSAGSTLEMTSEVGDRASNWDLSEATIFVVIDLNNSTSRTDILDVQSTSGGSGRSIISAPYNGTGAIAYYSDGSFQVSSSSLVPSSGKILLTFRVSDSGNTLEAWVDDTVVGSPDFSSTFTGPSAAADSQYELMASTGDGLAIVYDLIVYESVLSDVDLDSTRAALMSEYNI